MIWVDANEFRAAVRAAGLFIERRTTIPILGTMRLDFGPDGGKVTATDLDNLIEARIPSAEGSPFSACISARTLAHAAAMATGSLTFERVNDAKGKPTIEIKAGQLSITLNDFHPVEDFPKNLPCEANFAGASPLSVPEGEMRYWFEVAMTCASSEETRYYLQGAHIYSAPDGQMRVEATDGHKMARYAPLGARWAYPAVILPKRPMEAILRLAKRDGNREASIMAVERATRITLGEDITILSKVTDGTFPNCDRVIPKNDEVGVKISIGREAMRVLRPALKIERTVPIQFDPSGKAMIRDSGNDATYSVPVTVESASPAGINGKYIAAFLSLPGNETIRLEARSSFDPFLVYGEKPELTLVVMPMRV